MKKNKLLLTIFSPILSLFVVGTLVGCNNSNNSNTSEPSEQISSVEVSDDGTSLEEALIVSFESNGGTQYYDVEYLGGIINLPTPEREDYNFLGWYDNVDCTGDAFGDTLIPESSLTLYAAWEEIDYPVVSFVTNSETSTIDPIKYKGVSLDVENPKKYGYEFTGWYDNENYEGEAISLSDYAPTDDVTLYANYKEVTYIHYYYGQYSDYKYVGYDQGTVVEIEDLFNPGPMYIDGVECPFTGWTYEDGTAVGNTVTVDEEVILVAQYNRKNAPMKHYLTEYEKGILTSTGNVAYEHVKHDGVTYFEVNMMLTKGTSGGCGVAWRMDLSGNDYPYQDVGTTYLSAVLVPSTGNLQIASVTNGAFKHMSGSVYAFSKLPVSWQEKYNSETQIFVTIGVEDGGDYFNIYIDGELAFEYTDSDFLSNYNGTGFGIRCSSKGTDFKDFKLSELTKVNFDSNEGTECQPINYVVGTIDLPYSEKDGNALEGWYYDEALTQKVDPNNFVASSNEMTLYAKWTTDYHTVTLNTNGGSEVGGSVRYNNGSLIIVDEPTKENYIFTGWYYDSSCTQPVDMDNPNISGDITIYAGWEFPRGYVEKQVDGSYAITGKSAALHGVTTSDGYIVYMETSFTKGSGGAVGIMFNGIISSEYSIESGQKYLSVQFVPASGGIQISHINNGFAHLDTSKSKLTSLPQAWQDKFNNAAEGDTVTGTLKVIVSDDCFRAYIDNELIFTSTEAHMETIKVYTGNGYGIRSSVPAGTATYKISCKEYSAESLDVIRVTLKSNDTTINRYTEVGGTIPLFELVGSSSNLANGNAETITYAWKNGESVVTNETTFSAHTTIIASPFTQITRGTHIVVTEDENGKPVYTLPKTGGATTTPITIPDVEVNVGSISFDLTYTKENNDYYHHFSLLGSIDNSTVYYPTTKNGEGTILFGWNNRTGTVYLSYVISNGTKAIASSFVNVQGGLFNLSSFKTNYPDLLKKVVAPTANAEALPYGSEVTLNVKFVIENDGFKWYLDNCLLLTIGTVTLEEDETPCTSRTWSYVETTAINGSKAVANGPFDGITATTQGAVINEFFHDAVANGNSTFGVRKYHKWDTGDVVIKNIITTSSK